MKIVRIYKKMFCFLNTNDNEMFEGVLANLMIPVQAYDEETNTYTIHVTYPLLSYMRKEMRYRNLEPLEVKVPSEEHVVNKEAVKQYKLEKKEEKKQRKA